MADVHDVETRRRNMSAIRGKDTKPEITIRRLCHAQGFRFRLHRKDLPGKPDLVFPKYHAVVLVNGCFWHGHECHLFKVPETRRAFWTEKIAGNRARDEYQIEQLFDLGWRVMIVWECALKGRERLDRTTIAEQLSDWLSRQERVGEIRGIQIGDRSANTASNDA